MRDGIATPRMGLWARLREGFAHAFALPPETPDLDDEDRLLLDRMAEAVRRRGLQAPAILWLESMKPLHHLGAQALVGLKPLAQVVLDPAGYERFIRLLEHRGGIEELIKRIEATQ